MHWRCKQVIDVLTFIERYTPADEHRIRFDWNGKHAEEFVDHNMEFRDVVRETVLTNLVTTPIELIRDLFRAETEFSREAWCIADGVGDLAESLLRRGGVQYLDDYLDGRFQSFDASLGSAFDVDLPLAQTMLAAVRERLQSRPDSPRAELWRAGEELFVDWVASCNRKTTL